MPAFAQTLLQRTDAASIKAILGTSMVNRGPDQFGFSIVDLPKGWFSFVTRVYLKLLLSIIHPQGKDRLDQRAEALVPKRIAMSLQEASRRYGMTVTEVASSTADSPVR